MDEIARTNTLSNSDIEKLNMLIVAYEKLLKAEDMEIGAGASQRMYSGDGQWTATGNYDHGNSYGYDDRNSMRNSRYPRADESARDHIRRMMSSGNMSEGDRRVLERAIEII